MKKYISVAMLIFAIIILLYGKSLWQDVNIYKVNVKVGDIIKIKFAEKTLLRYRQEQKQNVYQDIKGKKGKGEVFSFFPDAEVTEDNTIRNQNTLTINNENKFVITAKIISIQGDLLKLQGYHSTLVNGEIYKLDISGECSKNSLGSDRSIYSSDVYNLDFKVSRETPVNPAVFNENDVVYTTNYTDIVSNITITSNNETNVTMVTNFSSFKLQFSGIQDSKKKQLLVNYLNSIINTLFR